MEENFDSSNSTLTHSVNEAAWKRKRNESDCDTATSHPLPVKMYDKNHGELFQQLVYARLLQQPYAMYKGRWDDIHLWNKIVQVAYRNNRYAQPTPIGAMQIVLNYGEQYMEDPQMQHMEDSPLRRNICIMFTPSIIPVDGLSVEFLRGQQHVDKPSSHSKVMEYKSEDATRLLPYQLEYKSDSYHSEDLVTNAPHDGLQKLLEVVMERQRAGLLPIVPERATSLPTVPELGVQGGLAVQFGEDVAHLKLSSDEMMLLIPEYGPISPTYVLMANHPVDERRDLLRSLVTKLIKNLSQPSAGSSTKKRIKP